MDSTSFLVPFDFSNLLLSILSIESNTLANPENKESCQSAQSIWWLARSKTVRDISAVKTTRESYLDLPNNKEIAIVSSVSGEAAGGLAPAG